jgi:hypothetical protein
MRYSLLTRLVSLLMIVFFATAHPAVAASTRPAATLFYRTKHFDVYRARGAMSYNESLALSKRLESTMAGVSQRFGVPFEARERIDLLAPQRGECAVRGLTFSGKRLIQLFYGPGTDVNRMQVILAHEFVHQLQRERFGDRVHQAADIILLEGWATLTSDDYGRTADGKDVRWRVRLRDVVARGELLPLTVNLDRDCRTTTRNSIYDQWASFVDYLQQTYGTERLAQVYATGRGRNAGTADYQAVYGKAFAELEADWRVWVVGQ